MWKHTSHIWAKKRHGNRRKYKTKKIWVSEHGIIHKATPYIRSGIIWLRRCHCVRRVLQFQYLFTQPVRKRIIVGIQQQQKQPQFSCVYYERLHGLWAYDMAGERSPIIVFSRFLLHFLLNVCVCVTLVCHNWVTFKECMTLVKAHTHTKPTKHAHIIY